MRLFVFILLWAWAVGAVFSQDRLRAGRHCRRALTSCYGYAL